MKINEVVITEGVWDTLKAVGAGAKGALQGIASGNPIQGAKAGAAASTAKSQQQDLINRVAQKAIASWSTQSQTIKTSTGQAPTPEQLASWWKRYTNGQDTTGTDNPLPTDLNNNAAVVAWLNKEVAGYMAKKSMPADAAPPADTEETPDVEVETPAQGTVTKRDDGKWYNEKGQQIVDPKDIAELERRAPAAQDELAGQTVTIGGQKLNPKDPKDAALIAKLQGQLDQQKAQTQEPPAEETPPAEEQPLPDVSQLTPEQRAELRKQLRADLGLDK
jgi:hypothetical protein